ncbi:ABC transporter ATP-binding protein/permease [Eubacteriales bacterium OttesenSCG-928-M02]|nr:ABC transporter ATP-binding protein/permease [Eubacteriales bacterium OttesenSCG-928-M02]
MDRGPGPGGASRRQAIVKPKNTKQTTRRLLSYLKGSMGLFVLAMVLMVLSTGTSLVAGYMIRPLINDYIIPGDIPGLLWMLVGMAVVYVVGVVASFFQNRILISISQRTVRNMRDDLFQKMQRLPLRYFDTHSHGDIMSRFTNDMESISNSLGNALTQLASSFLTVVGLLALMISISPILTGITIVMIPILFVVVGQIMKRSRKYYAQRQESLGALNGFIEEMVEGQKVVKVFSREEKLKGEFDGLNEAQRVNATKAEIFSGIAMPIVQNMNLINYAFTAAIGGLLSIGRGLDIGGLAVFLNYSRQFAQPLNQISSQLNSMQSALAGAERVFEMMDEEPEAIADNPSPKEVQGDVRFEHVYFSYEEGKPVLKDINIDVKAGQKVALVGSTGAGKTTIINLLTRFYEVDSGRITMDGVDIRNMDLYSVRHELGLVLQDTHLFTGTVMENIRYGNLDANDDECMAAARLVHADSFISRLPQGYQTPLTADGMNLSEGQRQLLGIARTAVEDPPILILDEATSSIDTRTERLIQQGMDYLMAGRTSFVIAHRISTIVSADIICVIEDGEIIEKGSHEELVALGGRYAALYAGQFQLE